MKLLHPTGMRVIGEYDLDSNGYFYMDMSQLTLTGKSLQDYTYSGASVSMQTDFTNYANNIVTFNNLPEGTDISQFIFSGIPNTPNTYIEIYPVHGPNISSEVINVDSANNQITLGTKTWLTYGNVAYVSVASNTDTINILHVTKSYNYVNDGNYSNTAYPIKDIVYAGDTLLLNSNTYTVKSVDYANNKVYTTTNILANTSNSLISVNRTFNAQTHVMLYGRIGLEYIPELITEDGLNLLTEDDKIIIVD